MTEQRRLAVIIDSDVLIAAAASPSEHSAGLVLLRLSEITLIDAVISQQVLTESKRNIAAKFPEALPTFEYLVERSVRIVPDPSLAAIEPYRAAAHERDLPILVAALESGCPLLATYNVRDFHPGVDEVEVLPPGRLVIRVRERLVHPEL